MARIVILIYVLLVSRIEAKPLASLIIEQDTPELYEQIALVVYEKRIILSMNTNQWTKEMRLGKFILEDKRQISRIIKKVLELRYPITVPKDTYSHHQAIVTVNGKKTPPQSKHYHQAFTFMKKIFNYKWKNIDNLELVLDGKSKALFHNGKKKNKLKCSKKSCLSFMGMFYLP